MNTKENKMVAVIFSTITGNGYKLAEAAASVVDEKVGPYNITYVNDEVIEKFDTFIITYWCDKGSADPDVINLLNKMEGKNIIILGTLGADINTAHAKKVCKNVEELVAKQNNCIGHFLCRGSIDLMRTIRKMNIPEGEKGRLTPERFRNQIFSLNHPNEFDLYEAKVFTIKMMKKLGVENRIYASE